jgi:hypothetical protein
LALLLAVLVGVWLLVPHLGTDPVPTPAGQSADGCTITLAADAPLGPDQAGSCLTGLTLTNNGLVPVTLTAPLPRLSGPGHVVTGLHPGTSPDGPAAASVRLARGEHVTVTVETVVPSCASPGDASGVTTVNGLGLEVTVGPLTRRVVVPLSSTTRVVVDGNGRLPACAG